LSNIANIGYSPLSVAPKSRLKVQLHNPLNFALFLFAAELSTHYSKMRRDSRHMCGKEQIPIRLPLIIGTAFLASTQMQPKPYPSGESI
jgi:hypothetical protein